MSYCWFVDYFGSFCLLLVLRLGWCVAVVNSVGHLSFVVVGFCLRSACIVLLV